MTPQEDAFFEKVLESAVRLGLLALLAISAFLILQPFVALIAWGLIIAVAVHPVYERFVAILWHRRRLAAGCFAVLGLALLLVPAVALTGSMVESGQLLAARINEGSLRVPPAPEVISTWWLIGPALYDFWTLAATNLDLAIVQVRPQLTAVGGFILRAVTSAGASVLQFLASIIVAAVILAASESGVRFANHLFLRLAPEQGDGFSRLTVQTIRGVALGVLGVAFLQATLAGLGFLAAGVPAAGLWAMLTLLLCVVQLGPGLVLLPMIVYVFANEQTLTAAVFAAWSLGVLVLDNVLKPLLIGRNVQVPILVTFLGAIGGFIVNGIIGLFVGAVVLVLAYELAREWIYPDTVAAEPEAAAGRETKDQS